MHPINEKDFNDYIKNNHKSNWKIVKFADKIKNIVCLLIGCSIKQLEDRKFKEKKLEEEWWYWKLERECGYSTMMLDYLNTSKEKLKNYKGLILVKTTPRLLLQLLGTECGRNIIHPNIWCISLFSNYTAEINENFLNMSVNEAKEIKYPNWIITDVRFPNELKAIKDRDGIIIRVNRPILNETAYNKAYRETHEHESENSLDSATFDYVIDNNSDISSLIEKVREILVKENILKLLDNE